MSLGLFFARRNNMFETSFSYNKMFERDVYDIYYNLIVARKRKRKIKIILILGVIIAAIVRYYYLTKEIISYSLLTIVLKNVCIVLYILATYIIIFDWHRFYLLFNKKLYLDKYKDNSLISIDILNNEAYIIYHSEKIILLPKYPLFQINKNKHFRVFVYDTQKYIFFTMTNSYYFIYIDKEQFSADKIKELQESLQNIYGKCYVKKY